MDESTRAEVAAAGGVGSQENDGELWSTGIAQLAIQPTTLIVDL